MDFIELSRIGIKAALLAGEVIQQNMLNDISIEEKKGGTSYASQVVTEVDKKCESVILSLLLPTCKEYDLALLSEETEDDGSRFVKDFFWCIDPLDGTLPFINRQPGYSVSIALVARDGTPYIGIVFDPITDTLYHAVKDHGAFKNDHPWKLNPSNDQLTYVTDRRLQDTRHAEEIKDMLSKMALELGLQDVSEKAGAGSVMNGIHVLENGPACMLKMPKKENGGGSIWDFAATACIFQELGLVSTNYNGGRLDLNKKDGTFMNHEGIFYSNF